MFALVGYERDHETYDSLNSILQRNRGEGPGVMELIIAAMAGDRERTESLLAVVDAEQPSTSLHYPKVLATDAGDYAIAERAARSQTKLNNPPAIRLAGHFNLTDLSVAHGLWQAASEHLDRAAALDPARARRARASTATLPFLPVPRADLLRVLDEVRRWQPEPPAPGSPPERAYDPQVRSYLLGLLSSRLDDFEAALAHADSIEALEDVAGTAVPGELATTIRADVAWRRGDPGTDVLIALEPLRGHVPAVFWNDPVLAQEHARYVRVCALIATGQHEEALRWLRNTFVVTPGWIYYAGPVAHLEARALEALGRTREATAARRVYRSFWRNADADLPVPG